MADGPSEYSGTFPGWVLAAVGDQVAEPGSYLTCDVGMTPVIVMRGSDGQLRAFVNMCRHRGMALVTGCGRVESTINCPYHAWKFDSLGQLRVIAQRATQFDGVDRADLGLLPAVLVEWAGMVFVNAAAVALVELVLPEPAASAGAGSAGAAEVGDWFAASDQLPPAADCLLTVQVRQSQVTVRSVQRAPSGAVTARVGIAGPDAMARLQQWSGHGCDEDLETSGVR